MNYSIAFWRTCIDSGGVILGDNAITTEVKLSMQVQNKNIKKPHPISNEYSCKKFYNGINEFYPGLVDKILNYMEEIFRII